MTKDILLTDAQVAFFQRLDSEKAIIDARAQAAVQVILAGQDIEAGQVRVDYERKALVVT